MKNTKPPVSKDTIILSLVQQAADAQRDVAELTEELREARRSHMLNLESVSTLHANSEDALREMTKRFAFVKGRVPFFADMSSADFDAVYNQWLENRTFDHVDEPTEKDS